MSFFGDIRITEAKDEDTGTIELPMDIHYEYGMGSYNDERPQELDRYFDFLRRRSIQLLKEGVREELPSKNEAIEDAEVRAHTPPETLPAASAAGGDTG